MTYDTLHATFSLRGWYVEKLASLLKVPLKFVVNFKQRFKPDIFLKNLDVNRDQTLMKACRSVSVVKSFPAPYY